MALERDFELLDDYLAGRLKDGERVDFEKKLNSDPDLKNEFELQQQLVTGVKNARIAELKAMMNNVPVPSAHGGEATLAGKIALWTVVAGLVATGVYLYFDEEKAVKATAPETEIQSKEKSAVQPDGVTEENKDDQNAHENPPVVSGQQSSSEQKPAKSPSATKNKKGEEKAKEPSIDVFDPTAETQNELSAAQEIEKAPVLHASPSIAVEIDTKNKKYDFHYQFKDGKLFLYGPFENDLYEILEFFSDDKRTMFLFYQENFYLLKDDNEKMKPLGAIQDASLIKKLKDYRKN